MMKTIRARPENAAAEAPYPPDARAFHGKRVFLVANSAFFVRNFLMSIVRPLVAAGCRLTVVCPDDPHSGGFREGGADFIPLRGLDRKGMNPIQDARLFCELLGIYRRGRPDLVVHFTVKPNIYGSMACGALGVKSVSAITGLGYLFINNGPVNRLARLLYKAALRFPAKAAFLNQDDVSVFTGGGLLDPRKAFTIPGTGIDSGHFSDAGPRSAEPGEPVVFLMSGRILWDKGIGEFVEAARIVRKRFPRAEFWILGAVDKGNPSAVPESFLRDSEADGAIKYMGQAADVRPYIRRSDVVVLPSYREGIPRSLLEAMAMGRPVIAADSAGCRDVVADGWNGVLVPVRDAEALAAAMIRLVGMDRTGRQEMGARGRAKVLGEFDDRVVGRIFLARLAEAMEGADA